MKSLWSRFAVVMLTLIPLGLPATGARAASILVTTPYDLVRSDGEAGVPGECSLREAVQASELAAALSKRTQGKAGIAAGKVVLEQAVTDFAADPDNNSSYPRGELLKAIEAMIAATQPDENTVVDQGIYFDAATFDAPLVAAAKAACTADTPDQCDVTVLSEFGIVIGALFGNPLVDNHVRKAIDLQGRVVAVLESEIERLENLIEIDGCDDGSFFDTILLEGGSAAEPKYYYLGSSIELALSLSVRSGDNVIVTRCSAANAAIECPDAVVPGAPSRLFRVTNDTRVELSGFTLAGGDAGVCATLPCPSGQSDGGGALEADGAVTLLNMEFRDNRARVGGAIHVVGNGSLEMKDVLFADNVAVADGGAIAFAGTTLSGTDITFGTARLSAAGTTTDGGEGNAAGRRGGALFVLPETSASVTLNTSSMVGNEAAVGSAMFVGGMTSAGLENMTIARNRATEQATINIETTVAAPLTINNLTLIGNTVDAVAGIGTAGIRIATLAPIQIANSIIAGNNGMGTECDFGALPMPPGNFRRNYYGSSALFDACPGAIWPANTSAEEINFRLPAGWAVIADPALPSVEALVEPLDIETSTYIPIYPDDVNNGSENRLVNRGAGTQDRARCAERDQRNKDRLSAVDSDCDIGAVEYQVGRRVDDEIELLVDEQACIDVIANDLGDANYVAGSLAVLDVERAGAIAVVISRADTTAPFLDALGNDLCPNQPDLAWTEAILFTPPSGFRGETNIIYGLEWETDSTITAVRGDVSGRARIQTESRGGITSSSLEGGAAGPLFGVALGLLALRRLRARRLLLISALLLSSTFAAAIENTIYVNSGLDELLSTPGDGLCTLREALNTAQNDQANLTRGDCLDGIEGPDIIEFAPFVDTPGGARTVTLTASVVAYGGIRIRCPKAPVEDPPAAVPAVDPVCTIRRDFNALSGPVPPSFRLIDNRGSLVLQRLTLEGGKAPATGANKDGGAIFSVGNLTIADSVFRNNIAASGGAIFLGGPRSGLTISGSTFDANESTNIGAVPGGGAIATSQSDDHQVQIQSSVFSNNRSGASAAALQLNSTNSVWVENSVLSGNESTEGAGAIDVGGVGGSVTLRNITVVDNFSGGTYRAIAVGASAPTLTSSIVAANFDLATRSIDANCGAGTYNSYFNLFGDPDAAIPATTVPPAPAVPAAPGNTCGRGTGDEFVAAATVYNRLTPADGYLTPLVVQQVAPGATVVGERSLHRPYRPLETAGIITDAGFTAFDAVTGLPTDAVDNQVAPFTRTEKCANIDRRGVSRAAGGRCDRGAYEYLAITVVPESAGNGNRQDRLVIVDILRNDLYDNLDPAVVDDDIKQDCTAVTEVPVPASDPPTVNVVWSDPGVDVDEDGNDDVCAEIFGALPGTVSFLDVVKDPLTDVTTFHRYDADSTEVPGAFATDSQYVVLYDSGGAIATKTHPLANNPAAPADKPGEIKLEYKIYSVDQSVESANPRDLAAEGEDVVADITISIDNVPPNAVDDEVTVPITGAPVVIDVLANDSDPDLGEGLSLIVTGISGDGCSAISGNNPADILYWQCQYGRVTLADNGVVTWTPDNAGNPFTETFSYELSDQDPKHELTSGGKVTIRMYRPDDGGGTLLGEDDLSERLGIDFLGLPGHVFFAALILLGLRRRSH